MLAFSDIAERTEVPLPPHPIIVMRIAELALEAKIVAGFKMVNAEITAAFFKNHFLFMKLILFDF